MRTLDRLCAGLQDGPVHVLLQIPNYILSNIAVNKKNVLDSKY
jgi:hypothetical protein